ncbi:hypothetical protein ACGF0D_39855 [Kitasatospora sp. NPDC048298]|uniref:hypothetical protein n=1 Tax=Kitasatospora sp. NPDC048298 TaxID=3364049 RepID=UPI00371CF5B4
MHINWKTDVAMPTLEEPAYRAELDDWVRSATDDDLLAVLLYETEGEVLGDVYESAYQFWREVGSALDDAKRLRPADQCLPVRSDYLRACARLLERLEEEADRADKRADAAAATVIRHFGEAGTVDPSERYRRELPSPASLEEAGRWESDLQAARRRLRAVVREHSYAMHAIALRELEYEAFVCTAGSLRLSAIDAMTPVEFFGVVGDHVFGGFGHQRFSGEFGLHLV